MKFFNQRTISELREDLKKLNWISLALSEAMSYLEWAARKKQFIPNYSWMKQEKIETENGTILSDLSDYDAGRYNEWSEEMGKISKEISEEIFAIHEEIKKLEHGTRIEKN